MAQEIKITFEDIKGKSAYEIWLDEGNTGSEQDFLDSLQGANGLNGTNGTSGLNGTSGTSGSSGTNGSNGTSGTSGSSGINGVDGSNGTSGTNGTSGINGVDGTNGTSGSSGTDANVPANISYFTNDSKYIANDISNDGDTVNKIWIGTEVDYDAIVSKDTNTLYIIKDI